jgi:hypothetical protein
LDNQEVDFTTARGVGAEVPLKNEGLVF